MIANMRSAQRRRTTGRIRGVARSDWKGDEATYITIHNWVRKHKAYTGVCSLCGQEARTEWANVDHKYRRDLDDYFEVCRPCHYRYDRG